MKGWNWTNILHTYKDSKGIKDLNIILEHETTWRELKTQAASAPAWDPSALLWIHTESTGTTQNKQTRGHQTEHRSHQQSERTVCTMGKTCATRSSDRWLISKIHKQLIQSRAEGSRSESTNFQLQGKC